MTTIKQPRIQRERLEQKRFVSWMRLQYPGMLVVHFANGGARDPREGRHFKEMGVVAGMPDLFIAHPVEPHHGLFIEMKPPKPHVCRIDAKQKEIMRILEECGYMCAVARGCDEAEEILKNYLKGVDISNTK